MSSDLKLNGFGVLTKEQVDLIRETLKRVNKDYREIQEAIPEDLGAYVKRLMEQAEKAITDLGLPTLFLLRNEDYFAAPVYSGESDEVVENILCIGVGPGVLSPGPPTATLLLCGTEVHAGRDGQLQIRIQTDLYTLVSEFTAPMGSEFVPESPEGAIDQQRSVRGHVSFVMTLPEGTKDFERRVLILDGIERPKETK